MKYLLHVSLPINSHTKKFPPTWVFSPKDRFISDRFLIRFENFPQTWIFIYERWTKYPILNEHVFIQDHMHTVSWATRVQSNIESIGKWYAYLNSIKLTVWMRATVQKKREKWLTPTRTTKEILGYWSQTTA